MQRRRPTSTGNWRIASRNGSDSMSPDRAADLGDDEVDVAGLGDQRDPLLDLVGDVRHDLHGAAEVVAAALAADHRVVDPAGGDVRRAARVGVGEALVVAEVEIGLGAVLGDEHLAVLVGRHRARVDVDVGVELLQATVRPRATSRRPIEAAAMPLPSEETTPPVTKMNRVLLGACAWRSEIVRGHEGLPRSLVRAAPALRSMSSEIERSSP